MRKHLVRESGIFTPRTVAALVICSAGLLLGLFSVIAAPTRFPKPASTSGGVSPAPTWAISASSNLTDQAFAGVNCVSASDCWAVGTYLDDTFTNQTLIEHWNGSAWSVIPSASVDTTQNNQLNGVSCTSTSNCWAVGTRGTNIPQTLIEHWNGTSWSLVSSPSTLTTQENHLSAVTCTSATDCWAVGYYVVNPGPPPLLQTLTEHWNGVSWAIVSSANGSTIRNNSLSSVTCTASNNCWAVGTRTNVSGIQNTLIEQWTGSSWAIVTSTNVGTSDNFLNGVACPSATACYAVGFYNKSGVFQTLVEKWNGTSWSTATSPNSSTTQNNFLNGITCTATTNCWAVGNFNSSGSDQTLIEHLSNTTWSTVPSPNTGSTLTNRLQSVTCGSATDCWAVGNHNNSFDQTLGEHWNNTSWSIVTTPNIGIVGTSEFNQLTAITCSSKTDCWAVGNFDPGSGMPQTLIEHWDGTGWSIINSPNPASSNGSFLTSVACTSSSNCWAAGFYDNGSAYQTLIEHWDSTSWSIVASPNNGTTQQNILNSVTCTSTSQCWAVGYYLNASSINQTLIEQWNGASWAIVTSPNTSSTDPNLLNGVTCTAATNCWAVGSGATGGVEHTLIARWNGTSWSAVSSPNTSAAQDNALNGVTCTSASNCWAVGTFNNGTAGQTLAAQWNGSSWAFVSSPNTSASADNTLNSVVCVSASDCSAVGVSGNFPQQTLIEQWNINSWKIVSSGNSSSNDTNDLEAVTCASASDCWAVGFFQTGGVFQTLIEKRSLPFLSLTGVSRPTTGPSAGHCFLTGSAVPNSMINVYATQNLGNGFTLLNTTMADANGIYVFDDAGAVTIMPPRRFYLVGYP